MNKKQIRHADITCFLSRDQFQIQNV